MAVIDQNAINAETNRVKSVLPLNSPTEACSICGYASIAAISDNSLDANCCARSWVMRTGLSCVWRGGGFALGGGDGLEVPTNLMAPLLTGRTW